jgi:hypothetical protein
VILTERRDILVTETKRGDVPLARHASRGFSDRSRWRGTWRGWWPGTSA